MIDDKLMTIQDLDELHSSGLITLNDLTDHFKTLIQENDDLEQVEDIIIRGGRILQLTRDTLKP